MGFADRLRAWFKGESKRSAPSKSTGSASRSATKELEEFVQTRAGVEGFLEPKTTIYSTTLLLVADDGEYLRRPIKSREQAKEFCGRTNIPLYDAAKVGYPRRMRDYEAGHRPRKVDLSELPPWPGDDPDPAPADGPPPPPVERTASDDDVPTDELPVEDPDAEGEDDLGEPDHGPEATDGDHEPERARRPKRDQRRGHLPRRRPDEDDERDDG